MFHDRIDAGRRLAVALGAYRGAADAVVLGIPRGGVVVGAEVARALRLPLDAVVVRKIGAPGNPEYAIGAMDEDGGVLLEPRAPVSEAFLTAAEAETRAEIARRLEVYRGGRPPVDLVGRSAILVDDGIATGLTALAAAGFVRARGAARVVLAAPVMPPDTARRLREGVDELVVLEMPALFSAVGQFYDVFGQTSDAEVIALLAAPADSAS